MFLLRLLIIAVLIFLAVSFFNTAKDYVSDNSARYKVTGDSALKFWKYNKK